MAVTGSKIHGRASVVYLSDGTNAAVQISQAADWTIAIDAAFDKAAALGDTWESQVKGLQSWNVSINGNYDSAQLTLFTAMTASTVSNLYIYPNSSTTTVYYFGTVWPKSLSLAGSTTSKETFKLTADGDDQLRVK